MQLEKTYLRTCAAPFIAALLAGGTVTAQSERAQDPPKTRESTQTVQTVQTKVQLLQHDSIIGADLVRAAGDGVAAADVGQELGSISELVIDGAGKVRYAVLDPTDEVTKADHKLGVPWDKLRWDPREEHFTTTVGRDELAKMPPFDAEAMCTTAAKDVTATGEAAKKAGEVKTGEATRETAERTKEASMDHAKGGYVLASKVADGKVFAQAEELGSVDDVYIDPTSGTATFVSVSAGGVLGIGDTVYLIPWSALRCSAPSGKDECHLHLDKAKAALESAPKLDSDKLNDATYRKQVYTFYGVDQPRFEQGGNDPMAPTGTRPNERGGVDRQ
jgi:sporulation protein YlmC with PRC-barrel domain